MQSAKRRNTTDGRQRRADQDRWVSASELGQFAFCPESYRLQHCLKLRPQNQEQLRRGVEDHARWERTEKRSGFSFRLALLCFLVAFLSWLWYRWT